MTRLSDDAIAAIRARAEAATPGPWRDLPGWDDATDTENNDRIVTSDYTDDNRDQRAVVVGEIWYDGPHVLVAPVDATFIAAARTDVPALLAHAEALEDERDEAVEEVVRLCRMADALAVERDALAAKLAEVERERDEARDRYQRLTGDWSRLNESYDRLHGGSVKAESERSNYLARLANRTEERDAALAEQRRLAAEVERMRPVVEAAGEYVDWPRGSGALVQSVIAYRAAPQPPAVEPPADHAVGCRYHNTGCEGDCDCSDPGCQREAGHDGPHMSRSFDAQANTEVVDEWPNSLASAIRALPDEEPPSGMIERVIERSLPRLAEAERQAEVLRCEVAVVEAALLWRVIERDPSRWRELGQALTAVGATVDALRAAREKAGGK